MSTPLLGFAGFIPYFILEGLGISLPLIGFTSIDPTYSLDGITQMMIFFAASFLAVVCYCEYHGITDSKVFTAASDNNPRMILIMCISPTKIS